MKINVDNRKRLIEEIKFVIKKMKEEKEPKNKLYYFSAIDGSMSRIFNVEFVPDLVFIHLVLTATYSNLNARLANPDKVIQIPKEVFDKLIITTEELQNAIEKNEDLYAILKKFSLLGFIASGNGYYLYQKGLLKI